MTKYKRAVKGRAETHSALQGLTASLDAGQVAVWEEEAALAMAERGERLRIYDVQIPKGCNSFHWPQGEYILI
jgi:hypothetical protein